MSSGSNGARTLKVENAEFERPLLLLRTAQKSIQIPHVKFNQAQ